MVAFRPTAGPDPVRDAFALARQEMSAALIEREDILQALRYAAWRAEEREIQIASA